MAEKIKGFHPTPAPLIDIVMQETFGGWRHVSPTDLIIEPSAGKGHLAKRLQTTGLTVHCIEVHPALQKELTENKLPLVGTDVIEFCKDKSNHGKYGYCVMNPPFEKFADMAHVRACFDLIKPGGRLTAIMSIGWLYGLKKPFAEFRDFLGFDSSWHKELENPWQGLKSLQQVGGQRYAETDEMFSMVGILPRAFEKSEVKANVETLLLVVDKKTELLKNGWGH